MDNPKKKHDAKIVSMQEHEIEYCRKLARKITNDQILRLAKSYLKVTRR